MMRTLQLCCTVLVVGAGAACSRAESDARAGRAADQVKAVAARAGDELADSWLTTKIQAQYFADDDIKARHIDVSTRDAVVTLTGYVDSQPQRDLVVTIARTTDGVRQVNDRLAVAGEAGAIATTGDAPGGSGAPGADIDDAQLTARVQSTFFVDDRVKGARIDVDTRKGVVTLSGEVANEEARAQALLLALTTEGVKRVEDHITIAPYVAPDAAQMPVTAHVDDAMLITAIQAKYFVDTTVKGSAVDVSAKDGVVLLQGSVANEAVRKQALGIAQNTEGVVQVVDRLEVKQR